MYNQIEKKKEKKKEGGGRESMIEENFYMTSYNILMIFLNMRIIFIFIAIINATLQLQCTFYSGYIHSNNNFLFLVLWKNEAIEVTQISNSNKIHIYELIWTRFNMHTVLAKIWT